MDEGVGLLEVPVGCGLVPHTIEPYAADGTVVGEEFGELAVHVGVEVGVEVAMVGTAIGPVSRAAGIVVRVVPVELGIIEEELDALAMAFVGQQLQWVFLIRRPGDNIPVGE